MIECPNCMKQFGYEGVIEDLCEVKCPYCEADITISMEYCMPGDLEITGNEI